MGEHRDRVLGDRELDPVAVDDRAAPGVDREILDLLGDRALRQRARLDRAEPGGAQGGQAEQEQEEREQQADAPLDELAAGAWPRPAASRRRGVRRGGRAPGRRSALGGRHER